MTRVTTRVLTVFLTVLTTGLVEPASAQSRDDAMTPMAARQIAELVAEKRSRTPVQRKIDSQLLYAQKIRSGKGVTPNVRHLNVQLSEASDGRILIDLQTAVTPALLDAIQTSGGTVISKTERFRAVRALVPWSALETIAARPEVSFLTPASQPVLQRARPDQLGDKAGRQPAPLVTAAAGAVTSEGDRTHGASVARSRYSIDPSSVGVAVLSDSIDDEFGSLAAAYASGEIDPSQLTVLDGQSGGLLGGEGLAMLEIVNDLAPGARLYFATAFNGEGSFAQNILDLRAAGAQVLIDDVQYDSESPFQDGPIAQAVAEVVADGALYFVAAGNNGNLNDGTATTWQGDFVDGGPVPDAIDSTGRVHQFRASVTTPARTFNTVTESSESSIVLFWSDPLGGSTNDYDLYVLSSDGSQVLNSSTNDQTGSTDPRERLTTIQAGNRIVIVLYEGEPRFLYLTASGAPLTSSTSGNTRGHNASRAAIGVAAVDVAFQPDGQFTGGPRNPVERFSSDGFRRIFFNADGSPVTPGNFSSTGGELLRKPDIAAADGVVTTLPSDSGLNPFFGTSAAAPHAGAVAALIWAHNPSLSADSVKRALFRSARDIERFGVDRDSGRGIVVAPAAIRVAEFLGRFPQ